MTAERQRSYRFATQAQWNTCVGSCVDDEALRTSGVIRPLPPYASPGVLYASRGARAPVVTRAGEMLWVDDDRIVHRVVAGEDEPMGFSAPSAIAGATRIVGTTSGLWVLHASPDALQCFDEESLARRLSVDIPCGQPVDVASDGGDLLFVLVENGRRWMTVQFDGSGNPGTATELQGIVNATSFVFQRRARRVVVLAGERHRRLFWFAEGESKPLFSVAVAALGSCFDAEVLASGSGDRILLAGSDAGAANAAAAETAHVLVLDADGNPASDLPLDPWDVPATGIVATRDSLFVTGPRGLLQFDAADVVPQGAGEVRCTFITPMLYSPDREDGRRWLRVDAAAVLSEGSRIEITYAATDDVETRDRLTAIAGGAAPASQRVEKLLAETELWRGRTSFGGANAAPSYSAKLFDVRERFIWICVTLSATAGASLPQLSELNVLYPGMTLMEQLPAIYQREESQSDSFLRGLVGVLEATTQDIDMRIASMASHVHPATAPEPWLDFVARWLGVPWDDGLALAQKRAIVLRAAELARGRGTRAGLEVLLECLLPGTQRSFRVTDPTADLGFALVGGGSCAGSALPAMLGGRTRWSAELDERAVLGYMRLPCPPQLEDGAWQLAGKVRVEVAATTTQREAWEPWFEALVMEMMPITARLELRWISAIALRSDRLDGTITLASPPTAHLGIDAVTGLARLPERGTRLSASGTNISTRLR